MEKKSCFLFSLFFISLFASAQPVVEAYPTHWYTGMKNPKLQLMIHGQGIGMATSVSLQYPGVKLEKTNRVENKNYLFLDLNISTSAKPGRMKILLNGNSNVVMLDFELKARHEGNGKTRVQGVQSSDLIYLLMPDRFANGDPQNDSYAGMKNPVSNRADPFARHGGDLKGVQDHLEYFTQLGITTLWLCPVVENDMPLTDEGGTKRSTYHGYAFTSQYQVDRRLGGNNAYLSMIEAAHAKGLKIIQDAVYNHVGAAHWFIEDLPMKDWLNQWQSYTNTSYKEEPLVDPYASDIDKRISERGWFTPFMPDLNQRNPFVANFLIQYAIWATENFGIDGWRVDTYFYNNPDFLNRMNSSLLREFPLLTVFGETLVPSVINAAYFSENNISTTFKHNLQGVTDQPLCLAILDALQQPWGASESFYRIYSTLAADLLYKNPMRNCIYLDNHDLNRFYSVVGEDFEKYKMGITLLLTLRGIPQLYYGTEILMKNFKNPTDAEVRKDFPGGWSGDTVNKFERQGRTALENEAYDFVKSLAHFRKSAPALQMGHTMQFVPSRGVFVFFRYTQSQTVMIICNANEQAVRPDMDRFKERTEGFTSSKDVLSGKQVTLRDLSIPAKSSMVLELIR